MGEVFCFFNICTDCCLNYKHLMLQATLRTDSKLMKKRSLIKETRVIHQYDHKQIQHESKQKYKN